MTNTLHKSILNLAIPATIENILQTLVGFIDTLMIAKLGLTAVTAVGVSNTILNVYLAVYIAIGVGSSALVSRNIGAKNSKAAKSVAVQSIYLGLIVSLVLGLVAVLFGHYLLLWMGLDATELAAAKTYFYLVGGLTCFNSLMTVLASIIRATGDTKSPMTISAITNVTNVCVDYVLIFGIGSFAGLGILGTAIGTVIARIFGTVLVFKKLQSSALALKREDLKFGSRDKELISLTIPATAERLVMRLGQVVYMSLIVAISSKTYASHNIAGSIESFVYMPAYGLATAAAVLIGMAKGEKDYHKIRQVGFWSTLYGVVILGFFGLFLFFGGAYFATFFTSDSSAIAQVGIALKIDGFIQPVLAISLILAGALQGMGDTKTPLYSTVIGMWGIRVVGVFLLGQYLGLGIAGVWLSILIDLAIRAIFLSYRFNKVTKILA